MFGFLREKIKIREFFSPLALIATGILAFGIQLPSLGLFQDDWHFIHYGSALGARGMLEFLTMDGRPTASWVYALGYPLLGFSPLHWQILSLTLRLVTVILCWLTLETLFPERKRANLLSSFFFLLYPFFTLQPQAVVYTEHWMSFALFFLSILLMLRAIQQPKRWLPYTAFAVLAGLLHLFTVEYFVGLELLRPFAIAIMQKNKGQILKTWLPYLLILLLFLYWRSVFLGSLDLRNDPSQALSFQTILSTLQNLGADIVLVLVTSWFKLLDPVALELNRARNLIVIAFSIAGGISAHLISRKFTEDTTKESRLQPYLLGGILAFLLGLAPAYAANFIIHLKLEPWNGRFALAALPGAGMLLAVVFESIFTTARVRRIMFAILIGLLIGWHNRVALDFRTAWEKQVNLFQQLTWRAPSILPGTAIITDQEILGYMGDYPTSFALNTIYDTKSIRPSPYWFFAMSENLRTDPESLVSGVELKARKYASTFIGHSLNSLIIVFEPEKDQCLWVLRPEDAPYRGLPEPIKVAARISNLDRIQDQPQTDYSLFKTILPQERGTWCFHYQRADLARQNGNWEEVIFFWELAQKGGYSPGHGFEYIPFIQAYAHIGNWETAFTLTKQSNRISANMRSILCPVWDEILAGTSSSPDRDSAFVEVNELLTCR